jgi:HSP20 family protein
MSVFFPRIQEFSPLFHLANELDKATRHHNTGGVRSFAPRFDVKETNEAFELNGELPGLDQSNINIEWTDDKTMTISGQSDVRNEYSNAGETVEVTEPGDKPESKQATVEDESGETEQSTAVTKTEQDTTVAHRDANAPKYWVTERHFGSFHRTFQFPQHVDHDNVAASLKNGVLSVVVPKAKPKEPRKITISS